MRREHPAWLAGSRHAGPHGEDIGLRDIRVDTRTVVFGADLAASYFTGTGRSAQEAGVISAAEAEGWAAEIADLAARGRLFCSIGYYLFTARVLASLPRSY
jgi:hypothetical protein